MHTRSQPSFRAPCNLLAFSLFVAGQMVVGSLQAEEKDPKVYTLDQMIITAETQQVSQAYTPMKSGAALIDTPASVSIATKELLEAQGATSLQDSIRNISGLMHEGNNYGIGDQLAIRGQAVSYTYDGRDAGSGGSGGGSGATVRSLTNVERIEVLKGPAGTLYGIGGAGGIVNLVEKFPARVAASAQAVGSENHTTPANGAGGIPPSLGPFFLSRLRSQNRATVCH